ncbi:cache domain-containing sensor histidine kinase [Paenibacillus hamazuiensis]|uniref:cache domain-containing sensor histidine kinase n=1 Tax=Paenibacillus hamazuiensis TaxID=2936508 RepID=UPI00200DAF51|nr:sensor histidine kinase [Paenibacillus hamazuiensis]
MRIMSAIPLWIRIKLSSFRNKLTFSFLLIAIVPLILVGVLSFRLSYNIARDGILNSVTYSSNRLNESLTNRFQQMEYASNAMQYYMYTLILQPSISVSDQLDRFNYIKNNISNLDSTFNFVNINVYTKPDLLFSNQGITFFKIADLSKRGFTEEVLKQNVNRLQWRLLTNYEEPFVVQSPAGKRDYITVYNAFKKQDSDNLEYAYFIDIDEKEISAVLAGSSPDPAVQSYIVDKSGRIVSHPNHDKLNTAIDPKELQAIIQSGGRPLSFGQSQIIAHFNPVTNWYVVTDVPNRYVTEHINILVDILLITVLLVIVAAVVTSFFISNNLSTKVRRMSKVMSAFTLQETNEKLTDLHIPVVPEHIYRDELDHLAHVFNMMVRKINDNFDKMLELNLQEEKLRYQLLQSKINPHFLYNILESIKTCQSLGRIEDANAMITRLAKFYRLILRKGDELVTIEDEWQIASLYLDMEKVNVGALSWTVTMDDGIRHFLIPKFSLQPLLENCIRHAWTGTGKTLRISVGIHYFDEDIAIYIKDNGAGIAADRLKQIRDSLGQKSVHAERFYALNNVHMRLILYGKSAAGLHIDSEEGAGTTVILRFPQMISDNMEL